MKHYSASGIKEVAQSFFDVLNQHVKDEVAVNFWHVAIYVNDPKFWHVILKGESVSHPYEVALWYSFW